jgi:hypothetical protein
MYHRGQPVVSEANKSHSPAPLTCLEFRRLAHNDIAHYPTSPVTCVVCLGLIFLAPTFKIRVVLLAVVVAIHLTKTRFQHWYEGQTECFFIAVFKNALHFISLQASLIL